MIRRQLRYPATPAAAAAARLVARLRRDGFETALVGGAVRDLLLGREPQDFDVVTTARPEELQRRLSGAQLTGLSFGVTRVVFDDLAFEVATAREERNYLDGRHPEAVRYADTLEQDVVRRDFTINALLLDPETGTVLDHTSGLADLDRGVVRTVGEPEVRFREDYLRMLRAVRFATRFRFTLAPETAAAIRKLAALTALLAAERIGQELTALLTGPAPDRGLEHWRQLGLLTALLPEAAAMVGVAQSPLHHPEGDVWEHTLAMLAAMPLPTPELAWSVLLHDVGKPPTLRFDAAGTPHFFNHEQVGAPIAQAVLERFRCSRALIECVVHAVGNHMAFGMVRREARIQRELASPELALELELNRLDARAMRRYSDQFLLYLDRLIAAGNRVELPEPLLRGRDLKAAGLPPGPRYKILINRAYELQLEHQLTTPGEALAWARREWEQH